LDDLKKEFIECGVQNGAHLLIIEPNKFRPKEEVESEHNEMVERQEEEKDEEKVKL